MTTLRTAAQQALEALKVATTPLAKDRQEVLRAVAALKAALTQQDEPVWMHPWPPVRAQQAEPVEPVAWRTFDGEGGYAYHTYADNENYAAEWAQRNPRHVGWVEPLYTAPPQRKPLTDEEILKAIGWERAEMYMKLTPNFPVAEAKKETLKNARAVERAVWEKNHGQV